MQNRVNFSKKISFDFPLPNLSQIQQESFEWFLKNGVDEVIKEIFPVEDTTGRNWELTFKNPRYEKPNKTVEVAERTGSTYDVPWYLDVEIRDKLTKETNSAEIYMGDIPMMTNRGTFVINGSERVVVNQLTRAEGVYFTKDTHPTTGQTLGGAKVLPKNGAWLEIETSRSGVITVKIDRRRKITITTLLRVFGLQDNESIKDAFKAVDTGETKFIEQTLLKDPSESLNEAYLEVYKKVRPGEPAVLDTAKALIDNMFFNNRRYNLGKVGRFKINQKLNVGIPNDEEHQILFIEDLIEIVKGVIEVNNDERIADDVDHLGNRRVRSVGELLQAQIRIGFLQMERNIRERMSLQPREELAEPTVLISTRPVMARIQSFFASSQLSQYQDQSNPLSGLDHLRRLTVTGPGGLSKERASFSVRDAHYSQYGKLCPIRTPEGPNVGLTTYLSLYTRPNEYGFLETPYRIIKNENGKLKVTDEVVYLAAYDEDDKYITDTSAQIDSKGYIIDERISLRHEGNFFIGDSKYVQYMDVVAHQVVGLSAATNPFVAHDDPNRALVAANQSNQAVPLVKTGVPIVGTGIERTAAENSGAILMSEEKGVVSEVNSDKIIVTDEKGKDKTYNLTKFKQSNMNMCYNQTPTVQVGDKVKPGSSLAEGPSVKDGELALGTNLRVAYMTWYGYGYEDAIVLSDRVVKDDLLTSIHITDHTVQVLETKLGPEEVTRDIPNVSEEALRNLDENGVVTIGSKVKSSDILVGKVAPKGETEMSAEERLLRAIFGEKAKDVRDNSLVLPNGEYGTVIDINILDSDNHDLGAGVIKEITVYVAQQRKIMVGDKLAGRHGNKGVISKIVPSEDMPHTEDGIPVDIILSPASVISRMNVGQLLEAHLGMAGNITGKKYAIPAFEKFDIKDLENELKEAGMSPSGKMKLLDGRTGEYFDQDVVIGYTYILKLHHLAEDKMHARSTGPYSLITQQPLGGKAQFGGQRFGEMEVWALEAHGVPSVLQEMLTIKSDDLVGRTQSYRAILQGEDIPSPSIPESFKLLVRELNGLGLKIEPLGMQIEEEEEVVEVKEGLVEEKATEPKEEKPEKSKKEDEIETSTEDIKEDK